MTRYGWILVGLAAACSQPSEERSVDLTVPVTVQPAKLGTIESTLDVTGTLRPVRVAELVTEMKGDLRISARGDGRSLREGDPVAKGDVVARLENEEWVVNANVTSRKLALENAERSLAEKEALFARKLTTETDVQTARKVKVDAETAYQDAVIQIEKTTVRSPIAGVLSEMTTATEGTPVPAGTVVGKVVAYDEVLVDLRLPNSAILTVSEGTPIRVSNHALGDRVFEGRVTMADPVLDPATRTFRVVGAIPNPDLMLRPGMFVKAELVTDSHEEVVLVPRQLVVMRGNRKVVFIESDGRADMIEVETGLEDRKVIEIVSGIERGHRLITSNYETLRPRTRVRVGN